MVSYVCGMENQKEISTEGQAIIDKLADSFDKMLGDADMIGNFLSAVGNEDAMDAFERFVLTAGGAMEITVEAVYHERKTGEKLIKDEKV